MEILDPQPQEPQRTSRELSTGTIVVGLVFVIVGLVLLINNTGLIPFAWRRILLSWQMLVILVGIVSIAKRQITQGIIFCAVGLVFMLPRIGMAFHLNGWLYSINWHNLWPLVFVVIGLLIVVRARNGKSREQGTPTGTRGRNGERFYADSETTPDGYIHFDYFFNGSEQVFLEPIFRGGSIETIFGGATLDLRRTSLPEGISHLKVESVFGGVTLIIPEEWNVELRSHCVFGGFSDKRNLSVKPINTQSKLVIEAECVFGGGEIK